MFNCRELNYPANLYTPASHNCIHIRGHREAIKSVQPLLTSFVDFILLSLQSQNCAVNEETWKRYEVESQWALIQTCRDHFTLGPRSEQRTLGWNTHTRMPWCIRAHMWMVQSVQGAWEPWGTVRWKEKQYPRGMGAGAAWYKSLTSSTNLELATKDGEDRLRNRSQMWAKPNL